MLLDIFRERKSAVCWVAFTEARSQDQSQDLWAHKSSYCTQHRAGGGEPARPLMTELYASAVKNWNLVLFTGH